MAVGGAERFPNPLAEGGRMAPEIDGDVKDLSAQTANKLPLRLLDLVMETAHHVFVGEGLIVLNERSQNTDLRQDPFIVAFEKGTSTIFEHPGDKELDIRNGGRC
jgi:hypothetical protein